MKNKIYLLKENFYNELAAENGASNTLMLSYNLEKILEKLENILHDDLYNNNVVINDFENIETVITNSKVSLLQNNNVCISIYDNKYEFDCGLDNINYIIECINVE